MKSPYSLEGPTQECPGEVCLEINIKRNDGDDEPAVCDSPVTPYSVLQVSTLLRGRTALSIILLFEHNPDLFSEVLAEVLQLEGKQTILQYFNTFKI